ncbi:Xaa-Pro peptidase family protein [Jeotgalibaca sp. MA1X17-3]|uniref:M24 family metallopeptidase n=1 Tax=Jeotgalibaca sp. MA1X17-3 TaxID=2908211 RepID=UPI001F1D52C1|nr:Xaa-Pro peptidase family protein [Jeotgalibaca sp. MA1X17-3]UJF14666.1 Xaa-Pro peptidase family protein [Jeotgalibaca sp. MA1X17-3]
MSRLSKIQAILKNKELDALLVTSPYNLRYVSNFTGTTGLALITQEQAFFITDFRYTKQAADQAKGFEIVRNNGPIFDEVKKIVESKGLIQLGFEDTHVSFRSFDQLETMLDCDLIPSSGIVEELREIKDESEIAIIKKACEIADAGFKYILDYIKPGVSEIEIANKLDFHMRELGATGVSFETIVASGYRSAMPHGVASEKLIEQGDFVTLDFGCYYNGYVSDMTRTVSVGEPLPKLKEIYKIVLEAQLKVLEEAKAGMTGIEVDRIARDVISSYGYGDYFGHSNGHGIGLEIHEGPNTSQKAPKKLVVGNVITNEPGIYLDGIGGVRIEDDLIITATGNEILTHSTKELIIL